MNLRSLAALAGAATLTLTLAACGGSDSDSAAANAGGSGGSGSKASACPDGSLSFGVEPYEDPKNLTPVYQKIASALGDALDCKVDITITDNYVGEILAMKNGKLDIGQFGPLGYVFAQREAGAVAVASFADQNGQLSTYTAGIWVPKGSDITDVAGLKGHTLALSEAGSTSGDALPRQQLVEAGIEKDVKTTYAGGHPEALLALTHGKVDAAEINSQTLASAQDEGTFDPSKYTQIWKSDPIANDPITVSPKLSADAQKAITDALLSLPKEDVEAIGKYLDFTSPEKPIVPVKQDVYQPLFDLADSLHMTDKDL